MSILSNRPTNRELLTLFLCLGIWLVVTALFVGIRPEHPLLIALIAVLFCAHPQTKKLVIALLPFILFAVSYDWMNIVPNYKVNPIDVQGLYEAEKSLFGITTAAGTVTPNEYFAEHHCAFMDFWAGFFYLCWVPVPILFGLSLYFMKQRNLYLRFAIVFLFVNLIGFAGYYIHPAAPPWYVMKYGFEPILNTPGDVAGLGRFDEMTGLGIFDSLYSRNSNVFAAVPSLHSAYMVIAFYYSLKAKYPNFLRVIFGIIMLGIWFTAVYSAHHYIIDAILGASCAVLGIFIFEKILMKWGAFNRFITKYTAYIS
jgi:hypothetical protein